MIREADEKRFLEINRTCNVQCLRRFFAGDSPQRPGFDPRSIHVTFVLPVPKLPTNTAYSSIYPLKWLHKQ